MIDKVREYYDKAAEAEWNRLNNSYSRIEYNSTVYLIEKYFPKTGHILDIGSGPGRYSLELLKKGYKVSLLDISNNELEIAKRKIEENNLKAEDYYCKSALGLDFLPDDAFDGVLVMGPLYHIHCQKDRKKVLKDTYRILKKNGTALISYINTWGVLRASVGEFPESFQNRGHFQRYIEGDLKFSAEDSFTVTYFTTPPLALEEIREVGFKIISYAGAESFLSGLGTQVNNLYRYMPDVYENYLKSAAEYCELRQYRDATEHLHVIVKKE
ncbi:class I SAM-dependent methyltransferase [Alkaliphilus sp. B6464]|uniref:class I SAM-dependent methyltransferase n=1 Tax=Alkaliphilus sp. B6464 TaxID=2731219 RepID=UPI001BAB4641|nr:class I SAM-dependent methyltransferase [Alkaliphilus sp. B6464]QUH19483.1 class I SAM-dependent methyltransferase [Alkaliphilus sp. B6464]